MEYEKLLKNKKIENLTNKEKELFIELTDLYWIEENNYNKAEKNCILYLSVFQEDTNVLFMFSQMLISNNETERADVLMNKIYGFDKNYASVFANMFKELNDFKRYKYWNNLK